MNKREHELEIELARQEERHLAQQKCLADCLLTRERTIDEMFEVLLKLKNKNNE